MWISCWSSTITSDYKKKQQEAGEQEEKRKEFIKEKGEAEESSSDSESDNEDEGLSDDEPVASPAQVTNPLILDSFLPHSSFFLIASVAQINIQDRYLYYKFCHKRNKSLSEWCFGT